ncbi:ABC-type multidrug transport system permease subunit [Amycolatopsis bartoniae]|uniref:Cardiolipin synthase N-terminal domain-containing protein n=1 Tax=Amycolatopsis bartoniae TaxID=941986 RepID=A0A8H9IYJ7_9PSEU|nr:PLDc N-terminal domain-containing protein [Amycolatopsis bartoniae]MBB2938963.1 ABC-type multidrug transport system permease subunit [Amycolatopsis bartoniae]GHF65902.1 hypothetical protein GCM10017566_44440 [Amycolatopsis bartoniae]
MTHSVPQLALAALIVALVAACVLFVVGAVVSVLRAPLAAGLKLVWIVLVCVAPFLGSLLWFVIGKRHAYATG